MVDHSREAYSAAGGDGALVAMLLGIIVLGLLAGIALFGFAGA
ncbi:MAG: hypothetical protein ACT4QG_22330 [Sporichthyaceae bacterium]